MTTAVRIYRGGFGRVALLECDGPLVTHAHPHCHVLVKISGSDTRFAVREAHYPLADDTAILVNAWEPHGYPHLNPDAPTALILAVYVEPRWLGTLEGAFNASGYPGFFPRPCVTISDRLRRCADDLAIALLAPVPIPASTLEAQLAEFMIAVIDPFSAWRDFDALLLAHRQQPRDPRLAKALAYLHSHLEREVDMGDVAREAGLSRAHLFALFRRGTSLTPEVYSNALRMEAALLRLSEEGVSIAALAATLGFSAPGHFTRFFRHHAGITPTDYRNKVDLLNAPR